MSSVTLLSPSRGMATESQPRTKFPQRTEILVPNMAGAEGALRRKADTSITSSGSEVVCIVSTIWARRNCVGSTVLVSAWAFGNSLVVRRVTLGHV